MKVFLKVFCILLLLFLVPLSACNKESTLINNVCSLKHTSYTGSSENYSLVANYGFDKQYYPSSNTTKLCNYLTFKLLDKETEQVTYTIKLNFNNFDYLVDFKLNPVSNTLTAKMEIDGFFLREFTAEIVKESSSEQIKFISNVPANTISYQKALSFLENDQANLIKSYTDQNGNFTADIVMRILVKDGKPYWYVGLMKKQSTKALLIDGLTGKTLAIRDIF